MKPRRKKPVPVRIITRRALSSVDRALCAKAGMPITHTTNREPTDWLEQHGYE